MSRSIELLKQKVQDLDRNAISTAFMTYSLVFAGISARTTNLGEARRWHEEAVILQELAIAVLEPCLRDTLPPDAPDTIPPVPG